MSRLEPPARCARVVLLEGPEAIAAQAEADKHAATDADGALWDVAQGTAEATYIWAYLLADSHVLDKRKKPFNVRQSIAGELSEALPCDRDCFP
ncbi:hypothetical protein [Nonomuraea sp. NPDC049695]|uniref:hypothetical protein n=1 Tax=Nonomuraea sp. NPDC049695 TaxID=3154734 RepID=UPI00341B0C93